MKINLFPFEKLEAQRSEVRERVGLPSAVRLDLAFDVVHGLNDVCRSLADLHPHKRSIAVLGAQPPPLNSLLKGFAGQGFVIQELPVSFAEFDEPKLRAAWDALKKDTLFVLTSAVEPLTGAVYPYEWVRKEAPKKNIFTLIYMSPDALTRGLIVPANAFEGVICDPLWGGEHTLVALLKGDRLGRERLFWGEPFYSDAALKSIENVLQDVRGRIAWEGTPEGEAALKALESEDRDVIVGFEEKIAKEAGSGVHRIGPQCRRLYDRAVLFIEGVHGEALAHKLREDKFSVETAAACAWENPHLNSWLPKMGFSAEWVESSLIVPLETVRKSDFAAKVVARIKELRTISGNR